MLKIGEVAKELKVSEMTIRRYIDCGKIKAIKLGGLIRIDESELERIKKEGL